MSRERALAESTVVVSSPMHQDGIELLRRSSVQVIEQHHLYDATDTAALHAALSKADAVITRSLPMTAELIANCPSLQIIAKHGAGLNTIDVQTASRNGIVVSSTGGSNSLGVAEAAVSMMLAVLRRTPEIHAMVVNGRFGERTAVRPFGQLSGKAVALVGFGNIARHVARICIQGFGNRVSAYDPAVDSSEMLTEGVQKVDDFESLLAAADIVSVHVPLLPATANMIDAPQLARMKPSAILVNTARGGIINEQALAEALQNGTIYGAGIDVFDREPPLVSNPLFHLPNVVLSPHVGGITEEASKQTAIEAATAVLTVLSGDKPQYMANPEIWDKRRRG